jgi:hypothetical protein
MVRSIDIGPGHGHVLLGARQLGAVSRDGSRVLAGSGEGALVIFDATNLEELVRIPVMQRVIEHLWLDDDGVHLVDGGGRHVVR